MKMRARNERRLRAVQSTKAAARNALEANVTFFNNTHFDHARLVRSMTAVTLLLIGGIACDDEEDANAIEDVDGTVSESLKKDAGCPKPDASCQCPGPADGGKTDAAPAGDGGPSLAG